MRILLVDGHYYAYRSFYAIQHLNNSKGEPTNAVYGYIKTLQRMLTDLAPDRAAVIFDAGLPQARMELHPEYKANRAETPEALVAQFPIIHRVIPSLGFREVSIEGEEADDLIASYAIHALRSGHEVILATNDKDLWQLVGEKCFVYQTGKEGFQLLAAPQVEEKWGVPPQKIGEILALTGDAVDNIPGVPGIGPKTAASLIQQFGDVENLIANLDAVKSEKNRASLLANIDTIRRNRKMVSLRDSLELPIPIEELLVTPDYEAQAREFATLEFKTFLREAQSKLPKIKDENSLAQGELF